MYKKGPKALKCLRFSHCPIEASQSSLGTDRYLTKWWPNYQLKVAPVKGILARYLHSGAQDESLQTISVSSNKWVLKIRNVAYPGNR
jgi:hypothetical protein